MMVARGIARWTALSFWTLATALSGAEMVNESARDLPIAAQADVVVIGGSTGAVAAAVAAANQGAKVFLAAPHPYLGEDLTATLQLWLEPGETPTAPLAQKIFADSQETGADPNRLPFTYQTDIPSEAVHRDTDPPSKLTDGQWADAAQQSVQYNGDVTITADLSKTQAVREVRVMAFRREAKTTAGSGFDVESICVSRSSDKQQWQEVATIRNDQPQSEGVTLAVPVEAEARYIRILVKKPESLPRLLLGEIEIVGPQTKPTPPPTTIRPPRPLHVKKVLDDALLEAGVQYLYSCYATDVLRDAAGQPCGVVIANRAGRQAVVAKTIIDATPRAVVARLADAKFRAYPAGNQTWKRVVIGGEPQTGDGLVSRIPAPPFLGGKFNPAHTSSGTFQIIEYSLTLPATDAGYAATMRVDQQARTLTYHPEQQYTSDVLFQIPSDTLQARRASSGPWNGVDKLPLDVCRPADVGRLFIVGGCADISREQAKELLRPLALIDLGERIGKAAAAEAKDLPAPDGVRLRGLAPAKSVVMGDVRESLSGVRPAQKSPTVPQDARAVPVLGTYDVVVIGGGTGGAPAGIGAARRGAKTLVVEYLCGLGGVGTEGAISTYYWGNRVGFTATVGGGNKWIIEEKMEWYRQELLKAGAEIWFGTIGCGALVHDGRVVGAVVATPYGRGVVLAKTVIDATGNSDVAAAAGAACMYTDASEFGMQGTGLPGRKLGESYNNTDFEIVDETDMVDVWQTFVYAKEKYPKAFDQGRLIDTRERRRIVGDTTVTLTDQINERTYPDSVVQAWSNFDSHGYTIDPYLLLEHPGHKGVAVYVPYRAMLPKGLEGLVVTGLSVSAHRDALPLIRMQPDIQNGGYAAGVAAAMAAAAGVTVRNIDVKQLQLHLVDMGNLSATVLEDKDSYPLSEERFAEAVENLKQGRGAAVIMTDPARALPLLEKAYDKARGKDQVTYAKALAVLGSKRGLEPLTAEVRQQDNWDVGWNYRGMGQFGAALSPLDNLIVALGRSRDRKSVPAILEKLELLQADLAFSHHRAVGLALELLGDPAAAQPLAELLAKPGMSGHVHTDIAAAKTREVPGGTNAEQTRRESLRELLLARALYRCGDYDGIGEKILREYTRDLRGHLARHAQAILQEGQRP
ncbi:MAG: FAD-dependent oxidoreductase [Planctomycetota bacterium]|nr:FAD-dependent oxidoreductase [Planctomycetota bacterium]